MAARQQTVQVEGALKAREREVSEVAAMFVGGRGVSNSSLFVQLTFSQLWEESPSSPEALPHAHPSYHDPPLIITSPPLILALPSCPSPCPTPPPPHPSPQVERLNKALEQSKSSEATVAALHLQAEEASRALGDELAVSGKGRAGRVRGGGQAGRAGRLFVGRGG